MAAMAVSCFAFRTLEIDWKTSDWAFICCCSRRYCMGSVEAELIPKPPIVLLRREPIPGKRIFPPMLAAAPRRRRNVPGGFGGCALFRMLSRVASGFPWLVFIEFNFDM